MRKFSGIESKATSEPRPTSWKRLLRELMRIIPN